MARDIPGVLDILFPRLTGGLVASLNRKLFSFSGISAVPEELIGQSRLQKAMLFELAMARAEALLDEEGGPNWDQWLKAAISKQRQHYDARIPTYLDRQDIDIATHASDNLLAMLRSTREQDPDETLVRNPVIPGLGWIASGVGDFSFGQILIEVKHTDRNFVSADLRQILLYWILKYAASVEKQDDVWSHCLLLNPRRNMALSIDFDHLSRTASENSSQVELFELLRSIVGQELERR